MSEYKGFLDYSMDWSVSIGGTDITKYVKQSDSPWFIEQTLFNIESPEPITLTSSSKLELELPRIAPDNFSLWPPENSLLKELVNPVRFFLNGTLVYTARIREWEAIDFDDCSNTVISCQLSLTDKLGLANKEQPAAVPSGFTDNQVIISNGFLSYFVTPWAQYAKALIESSVDSSGNAYFSNVNVSGVNIFGKAFDNSGNRMVDGYTTPPNPSTRPINDAAQVSAQRGYAIALDASENIIFLPIPNRASLINPVASLSCKQVESETTFNPDKEIPDKVEVTGSQLIAVRARRRKSVYPQIIEKTSTLNGEEVVVSQRINEKPIIRRFEVIQSYRERQRGYYLDPINFPNSSQWITTATGTITSNYNGQRELVSRVDVSSRSRALLSRDAYPNDYSLSSGVKTELKTIFDANDKPSRVETKSFLPAFAIFRDATAGSGQQVASTEGVVYKERNDKTFNALPFKQISSAIAFGTPTNTLVDDVTFAAEVSVIETPPSPELMESNEAVEEQSITKSVVIDSFGQSNGSSRSLRYANISEDKAQDLAALIASLSAMQRVTAEIVRPWRVGTDVFQAYRREDVGYYSLLRVGLRLEAGTNGVKFSYSGLRMGRLASEINPPKRSLPPTSTGSLQLFDISDQSFIVGTPITDIPLLAFDGQPPYSYSDGGTLPAGLFISGNTIAGSITEVGNTSVTITVTDTLSNTNSKTFNIESIKVPVAAPHWEIKERIRIGVSLGIKARSPSVGAKISIGTSIGVKVA